MEIEISKAGDALTEGGMGQGGTQPGVGGLQQGPGTSGVVGQTGTTRGNGQ